MHASGYLAAPQRNPVSLGLAISITGAGLTAMFLIQPVVQGILKSPPVVIDTIPLPPAPPLPPVPHPPTTPTGHHPMPAQPQHPFTRPGAGPVADPGPVSSLGGSVDFSSGGIEIETPQPPTPPVYVDSSVDPRFAGQLQPNYPAGLQREDVEGSVTVRVHVGPDGRVIAVEAVHADHPDFLRATREWALRHWRFRAATRDGVPVDSWRTMSVRFQINRDR